MNIVIAFSTVIFAVFWGTLWIFLLTASAAALFDLQFIIIQRYNRPRLIKLIEREQRSSTVPLS